MLHVLIFALNIAWVALQFVFLGGFDPYVEHPLSMLNYQAIHEDSDYACSSLYPSSVRSDFYDLRPLLDLQPMTSCLSDSMSLCSSPIYVDQFRIVLTPSLYNSRSTCTALSYRANVTKNPFMCTRAKESRYSSLHLPIYSGFEIHARLTPRRRSCYLSKFAGFWVKRNHIRKHDFKAFLLRLHPVLFCSELRCFLYDQVTFPLLWIEHLRYLVSSPLRIFLQFTAVDDPQTPQMAQSFYGCSPNDPSLKWGGGKKFVKGSILRDYVCSDYDWLDFDNIEFRFVEYVRVDKIPDFLSKKKHEDAVPFKLPIHFLVDLLSLSELQDLGLLHSIKLRKKETKKAICQMLESHHCDVCDNYLSFFDFIASEKLKEMENKCKLSKSRRKDAMDIDEPDFPPQPPSASLIQRIVRNFCRDTNPSEFEESGCAVCGQLCPFKNLTSLQSSNVNLNLLCKEGVSRAERRSENDPLTDLPGPIIDTSCQHICNTCEDSLLKKKVPKFALCNDLWIGAIPNELKDLTFAEHMMISRVRHNRCVMRVSSGRAKMIANAIAFANPTVLVYHTLPPTREEMNEVLAFIYTGSSPPTDEDFKRTPMLVRRDKVSKALDWLKLNHRDYADLQISKKNLDSYPLFGVPVNVSFKKTEPDRPVIPPLATSVHHDDDEAGTEEGPCPFVVHGLTGQEYETLSIQALKAKALRHLESGGFTLGIGHESAPQSMYDNPQLYPQMFPWLFPYGYGGIGQESFKRKISEAEHKKRLLMYHDKRFQTDLHFPIIAFNHEQIKNGVTGSFLMTRRHNFTALVDRLSNIDKEVLKNITNRLLKGEHVKPETDAEKACFTILDDLDYVGGHVNGSLTAKKYMRNEIWSLISFKGAPSWFITLSPADNRHPISLYFADTQEHFTPEIKSSADRNRLTASNPVAAARFFDLVVKSFIKNVLGVGQDHPGLYGKTGAYYGTVEQQGRLTLHLHMLLWIKGALSPQEIRERLLSEDSAFQKDLIAYLEACHQGELYTGTLDNVQTSLPKVNERPIGIHGILRKDNTNSTENHQYKDPTLTLPESPPEPCHISCKVPCQNCQASTSWWQKFKCTVDDLLVRSNVHRCAIGNSVGVTAFTDDNPQSVSSQQKHSNGRKGCLDKFGNCRARFPRDVILETVIDDFDGHILMKKLEPMMNTFTPCLTYLLRCNTDTTSLLSGTSIKAIVSYISDYITKPALKSHQIFSSMYDVFQRNPEIDSDDSSRRLILQLVNNLTSKLEIGSPMAAMYLLGNPDHYTSHSFMVFSWKSYVNHVRRFWNPELNSAENLCENSSAGYENVGVNPSKDAEENITPDESFLPEEKLLLGRQNGNYVGTTNVDDYRFRPDAFSSLSLYEWIQTYERRRGTKKELETLLNTDANGTSSSRSKFFLFQPGHPLRQTHVVTCHLERQSTHVPNFIGGSLPRCDQGDREYYCCTMLTLFCPWRDGGNLKGDIQTWEDAFANYGFSSFQRNIMKNFNLRYECLDARDDFHSERKSKERSTAIRGPWIDEGDTDEEDEEGFHCDDADKNFYDQFIKGKKYLRDLISMDTTSGLLRHIGWLERKVYAQYSSESHFTPAVHLPSSKWSAVVKELCNKIFRQKLSGYFPSNNSLDASHENVSKGPNKLIDLLTPGYFLKNFRAESKKAQDITDETVTLFSLNEEQERAFRIISNHTASLAPDQLRMYLGGMGGTGKTQVIKALIHMFGRRNENHRFIVLAPTGTAAALINGTTYHRALGIRSTDEVGEEYVRNESSIVNEARDRLQGVQYIFLDEISMVSCKDLYAISARLAQIRNVHHVPFGGLNFIVAGDFAQLPPIAAAPLYSNSVYKLQDVSHRVIDQENTMGKILWHQFTTVVILKQNMRQRTQSEEDSKLRTALVNMRYAACTKDDIAFLRTRIINPGETIPVIKEGTDVRNVAIITRYNKTKDCINEEACQRFAEERGLQLHHFYSIDKLASSSKPGKKQKDKNPNRKSSKAPCFISQSVQEMLWTCGAHTNEKKIPAKLSLCIGMPVIIRYNEATELCITRDQDGIVVGWNACDGPHGQQVLETIFMRLVNPPKEVNIPGLPTNVVPLSRMNTTTKCRLPSDREITVQRQQVPIAPNFAITDYTSQGKTRNINVVDIADSENHLSIYTCLSRSSSAAGTIIIRDFDESIITAGLSNKGWLRQEFRELNALDEITRLRYEGALPEKIFGPLRNPTLHAFYLWKKGKPDDQEWHSELRYAPGEKIVMDEEQDGTWDLKINAATLARGVLNPKKRSKRPAVNVAPAAKFPKLLVPTQSTHIQSLSPRGLTWDSINYSCAFDSVFIILYYLWANSPGDWSCRFTDISPFMSKLSDEFKKTIDNQQSIESARNATRLFLRNSHPDHYPVGQCYTSIDYLCEDLLNAERHCGMTTLHCSNVDCGYNLPLVSFGEYTDLCPRQMHLQNPGSQTLSTFFGWTLSDAERMTQHVCPTCFEQGLMYNLTAFVSMQRMPYLVFVKININFEGCTIDKTLEYHTDNCKYTYHLRGIIYSGQGHFVSRIVDNEGIVWFHDGITTGSSCQKESHIEGISDPMWWNFCSMSGERKVAIIAIYDR